MLSNRGSRIATGIVLSAILALGSASAAGRALIRQTHRHVEIEVFNNDSIVQIFVNCHQVAVVGRGEVVATRDLGWVQSDDRIFLSASSRDGNPSWGFRATSNGTVFFEERRGQAEVLGFPAEPDAVVFAKAFSAKGDYLGQIGCQPPGVVSVPNYVQSPDDAEVAAAEGAEPPYGPSRAPYDQIDAIGRWSWTALAVLGAAAALGIGPIRRLAWSHRKLAGSAVALLATVASLFGVLGVAAVLTSVTIAGVLLLLAVATLLTLPAGRRYLERAAGTGGAQG
jgi:hypothetical protein